MIDVNALTVSQDDLVAQMIFINETYSVLGMDVDFIEFGNEYFVTNYKDWYPTGYDYIEFIRPALERAREIFPNARLGVIASMNMCFGNNNKHRPWNEAIAEYQDLFDAIAIHEYTACGNNVDG